MPTNFSATAQALGYYYQIRYALLHILSGKEELGLAIEKADDIETSDEKGLRALLQLKHHTSKNPSLTDSSIDFWKTIRIWSTYIFEGRHILKDTALFITTNASCSDGSISSFLRPDKSGTRNPQEAINRIDIFLQKTKNSNIRELTDVFSNKLSPQQRNDLISAITVLDLSSNITDIPCEVKKLFLAARREHYDALYESLEGWWFNRVVRHLTNPYPDVITRLEVQRKLADINDELKQENLPSRYKDENPNEADIASDNRLFVKQLRMIGIHERRIYFAIRDHYRAYGDRSFWLRTNLLIDDDLEMYHKRLVEKWEEFFAEAIDDFVRKHGKPLESASDDECKEFGDSIYRIISNLQIPIRRETSYDHITRGSYHILADLSPPEVWWHPRLLEILDDVLAFS